jgi:hypothetical protein
MKVLTRCLAIAAIALVAPALAAAEPITVIEPSDGAVLRGGSSATIAWTATGPLPRGVVEWEAFLSVDGGRYFSTRITPHLDIDIRSFEWQVPNVSSNDVRLLLRIGDEREEKSVDVPLRFSIVAEPDFRPSSVRFTREGAEAARPGDPAVVVWATGDREGREVGLARAPLGKSLETTAHANATSTHGAVENNNIATPRTSVASAYRITAAPRARGSSPLLARDILLLARRRNI